VVTSGNFHFQGLTAVVVQDLGVKGFQANSPLRVISLNAFWFKEHVGSWY